MEVKLPEIDSLGSLAAQLKVSPGLVRRLAIKTDLFYNESLLPKKSGGTRCIAAPTLSLKAIQAWILRNILDQVAVSPHATAFRTRKSIADNARPHRKGRNMLSLDISDFFGAIGFGKVLGVFMGIGYSKEAAILLASLCTLRRALPQGAVTSPALSNLVMRRFDARIGGYCRGKKVKYTRYADDMTFSSSSIGLLLQVEKVVRVVLLEEGFLVNEAKRRLMTPSRCRKITGLVISESGIGIGRRAERQLRALLHRSARGGRTVWDQSLPRIAGHFAFVQSVDPVRFERLSAYRDELSRDLEASH